MRKVSRISVAILLVITIMALASCNVKPSELNKKRPKFDIGNEKEYALTFEDNFDGDEVDTTKWNITTFDKGMRRSAYYTNDSDTLYVDGGNLVMKAIKRNGKLGDGIYTSWLSTSKNFYENSRTSDYEGFNQNKGYFEVRCIPLKGEGIWSAFWMMPDSSGKEVGSKDGAEIDIMESHYYPNEGERHATSHAVHVDEGIGKLKSASSKKYYVDKFYEEFHTFGMKWTEKEYVFYIDGYETWRTNHYKGVSEVAQYLKLTVEVGGSAKDGKPIFSIEDNKNPLNNDWATADIKFVVDYVRAYSVTQ